MSLEQVINLSVVLVSAYCSQSDRVENNLREGVVLVGCGLLVVLLVLSLTFSTVNLISIDRDISLDDVLFLRNYSVATECVVLGYIMIVAGSIRFLRHVFGFHDDLPDK